MQYVPKTWQITPCGAAARSDCELAGLPVRRASAAFAAAPALGPREARRVEPQLPSRLGREAGVGEHPAVLVEEPEHLLVLLQVLRWRVSCALRSALGLRLRRGRQDQAESGRTHPSLGLSGSDLHLGDRATAPRAKAEPLVSLARVTVANRHKQRDDPLHNP